MSPRSLLTVGNFFSAAHFFLVVYIITPYLATFMPASSVGLVVSVGAAVTLIAFPFMPKLVAKHGPRRLAIYLSITEALVLVWLAMGPSPLPAFLLVAIACAVSPLIDYQMDLLLEATVAKEGTTGRVRTMFITAANIALVMSPLIIGLALDDSENYARVFLIAAASLLPFIGLLTTRNLPHGEPPDLVSMVETVGCLIKDRDLRAIGIVNAVLQFFYHLAPLYIPLYLHDQLGMPWSELSWVLAIALIPFVLLEYPAGWLADRRLGDKELLVLGFVIMGAAFTLLAYVGVDTPIAVIVGILIATRIGAALVEAMTEGHFFRRVSASDANTVSLFRMARPFSALIAPLVGTALLSAGSYGALFVITGSIIVFAGVYAALRIKDIR
jgi:MFS family permease